MTRPLCRAGVGLAAFALASCAPRQIEGWHPVSLQTDVVSYESIVEASDFDPQDEGIAAIRTVGRISSARYQLDHLAANVGRFKRSEADWQRMREELLAGYAELARLASLPVDRLAQGEADAEIAAGLAEARRLVGRWGGAPPPERGSRRIRP